MVKKVGPDELDLEIRFGGGLHTRASESDIHEDEAADGANFQLDLEDRHLRSRKPFDLIGTVPGSGSIMGGASYRKADGSVSFLIQRGADVLEWDGNTTFTSVLGSGVTIGATAQLRGHWRSHAWELEDKILITDLALVEEVKEWDGTTFADVAFKSNASTLFGTFFAKYCQVSNERALFSHIKDPNGTFGHMMVGSKRGDYEIISVSDRPSSSLSEEDPFFLLTPDLRPINGIVEAFGTTILSTAVGQIFNLTGASAKDFAFSDFYPGSAASGEESIAYIGNDIIYGRPGRVESVRDTDRFGDSEADDLTKQIQPTVKGYTGWRIVYNSRLNRVYLFPTGISAVWVFETAMLGGELSPWMRWTTSHALAFQPTFAMSMLDPDDGLEYVFMGDTSGNLYRLEGEGTTGDGGANNITLEWVTKTFSAPLDSQFFDIKGFIEYHKGEAATVELIFEFGGETQFNERITVDLPAVEGRTLYGGGFYYNNQEVYGTIAGKHSKAQIWPPGQASDFKVRIKVIGNANISIHRIFLRMRAAG